MEIISGSKLFIAGEPYGKKDISKAHLENANLKLHLSSSGLEYLIANENDKRLLYLQPYKISSPKSDESKFAEAIFEQDELLKISFAEKKIGFSTPAFTIIPGEFANADLKNIWGKKFIGQNDECSIYSDHVDSTNAEIVYAVPHSITKLLKNFLGNIKLQHSITSKIESLIKKNSGCTVYCNVQSDYFELIIAEEKKLLFANIFPYKTSEDFLYYLLATYGQLNLDAENIPIVLSGEIMKESRVYQMAYKYIRKIEFAASPSRLKLESDYPFPAHFYFSLFCL